MKQHWFQSHIHEYKSLRASQRVRSIYFQKWRWVEFYGSVGSKRKRDEYMKIWKWLQKLESLSWSKLLTMHNSCIWRAKYNLKLHRIRGCNPFLSKIALKFPSNRMLTSHDLQFIRHQLIHDPWTTRPFTKTRRSETVDGWVKSKEVLLLKESWSCELTLLLHLCWPIKSIALQRCEQGRIWSELW